MVNPIRMVEPMLMANLMTMTPLRQPGATEEQPREEQPREAQPREAQPGAREAQRLGEAQPREPRRRPIKRNHKSRNFFLIEGTKGLNVYGATKKSLIRKDPHQICIGT